MQSVSLIPLWSRLGAAALMVSAIALVSVSYARESALRPRPSLAAATLSVAARPSMNSSNELLREISPETSNNSISEFTSVADAIRAMHLPSFSDIATLPQPAMKIPVAPSPRKNVRQIWMEVTAYCPCKKCCGPKATGLTASGKAVTYNAGRFVAADTKQLPFGTRLLIPGYHENTPVEVIDRGGAIKGNKLDVFFPTHEEAKKWGRKWVAVSVVG